MVMKRGTGEKGDWRKREGERVCGNNSQSRITI